MAIVLIFLFIVGLVFILCFLLKKHKVQPNSGKNENNQLSNFSVVNDIYEIKGVKFSNEHFFLWIDSVLEGLQIDELDNNIMEASLLPVDKCQPAIKNHMQKLDYNLFIKKNKPTIGMITNSNGKVIIAQIIVPDKEKGFDSSISGAINHGKIYASKIKN